MRHAFLAFVTLALLPAVTSAQSSGGLFGSSGSAGGRAGSSGTTNAWLSTPSTPSTASSGGQTVNRNATGGSTNASTGSPTSGTGSSGTTGTTGTNSTGSTIGQGTTGAVGAMSGQQILGASAIGNNAFTGRAANATFIGVNSAAQQANLNAFNQMFQGLQRGGGFGNNGGRGGNQANADRYQLRPTYRVGFDYAPAVAATSVASPSFATRFSGITERRPQLAGVKISSDYEGRVVLRGTVASEDSKSLAAALLRLEPGVREVVNELSVEPPAAR